LAQLEGQPLQPAAAATQPVPEPQAKAGLYGAWGPAEYEDAQ
jgi:hypothetical protein